MKSFIKTKWKYIVIAIVALLVGSAGGPSQDQLDKTNSEIKSLQKELTAKTAIVTALRSDKKQLETKVEEAQPWFALSKEEQKNKQKEADAKAADLAKQEAEKKAAEEKAASDKAAAEKAAAEKKTSDEAAAKIAARQKTFGAGKYVVGRDIASGLYDTKAVRGQGNFVVNPGSDLKVNEMFGVGGGFYNGAFNNLELEDGDTIEINNDLQIQFIPK
jgi:TolA-binding protein